MKKSIILIFISSSLFLFATNKRNFYADTNENISWGKSDFSEFEKKISDVEKFFAENRKFTLNITHTTYKGINTTKPHEKISGAFIRNENKYKSSIMGITSIQNGKVKIVIDTMSKTILVASPDKLESNTVVSLEYLQSKKNIHTVSKKIESKNSTFKLEYSYGQYLYSEIRIGNDNNLEEMTIVFREKHYELEANNNSKKVNPKAVITFSGFKKNPTINESEFDISPYLSIPEKGNPIGVKAFKDYTIVDTRVNYNQFKK